MSEELYYPQRISDDEEYEVWARELVTDWLDEFPHNLGDLNEILIIISIDFIPSNYLPTAASCGLAEEFFRSS